ncbi:HAMP domain-containing sensor histidine kinase [Paenibacillus montanisoli]|uniref:histidine kinase n=1 Tax=Paenibacillus montanisoli TaxID=2081970 RepID=A0A328TTU1_9BACL|nr:HAMP domain-containing sensor histidine kinase [Paenibacillus montanisoli]RAP73690.1 hypothetical protein DL346_25825 [Paenibacillus montanisoli]
MIKIKSKRFSKVLMNYYLLIVPLSLVLLFFVYSSLNVFYFSGFDHNSDTAKIREELIRDLMKVSETTPDKFTDQNYISLLDQTLEKANLKVAILHDTTVIYLTNRFFTKVLLYPESIGDHFLFKTDFRVYAYKEVVFHYKDGTPGSLIIFNNQNLNLFMQLMLRYDPSILLSLFVFVLLLHGILSVIISKQTIKPLVSLTVATQRISKGDLNFQILSSGNGEISELASAFDKMRRKLKRSVELQMEQEEMRKWSLASFTHDFATPLMSAKGYVQGLLDGVANTPEKQRAYLNTISIKIDETESLYKSFLLFYKLNTHQMKMNSTKINIFTLLQDYVNTSSPQLQLHGGSIKLEESPEMSPFIYADEEHLRRILRNILENSMKYCNNPLLISIRLTESNHETRIEMTDNGPGIKDEEIPYVFDRFYRAKHNKTVKGSGLGLAIAYHAIKEMGGNIGVESGRSNGFRIWFTLPQNPYRNID